MGAAHDPQPEEPPRTTAVSIGNAGEHLVMAELLYRGYQAFRADRGNPAFDIAVDVSGRTSLIRVKTTTADHGAAQWSAKSGGRVFLDKRDERDFVAIVDMRGGPRGAVFYLVPTRVVKEHNARNHHVYLQHPRRDGRPGRRKDCAQRIIRFDGPERPDNPTFNYADKWAKYREAWHQLEPMPRVERDAADSRSPA